MAFKKSSPELVDRFKKALPDDPSIEPRSMFGFPCAFVGGNFFSGLFEELVVIRMPDPQKSKLGALAKAEPFSPMKKKPMTGWYVVPGSIAKSSSALADFLEDALALAKELPTKKKAPKKKKKR